MAKEPVTLKFKNKDEIRQASEELAALRQQPGWQRVIKYYDEKIAYLETLLHEGEIKDMAELNLIRARRNMAIQFCNLPDILVGFLEVAEGEQIELDPFAA